MSRNTKRSSQENDRIDGSNPASSKVERLTPSEFPLVDEVRMDTEVLKSNNSFNNVSIQKWRLKSFVVG